MGKNEGGEGGGKGNSSMVFNPSNERSGGGGEIGREKKFIRNRAQRFRRVEKRRVNKGKVYCRCGVRFVMVVAARIEGDGRRFEGVYEALCVTRWKNDPPP